MNAQKVDGEAPTIPSPCALATPRVWLLMGHKPGDNAQVQTLADALEWPYEIKRMVYRPTELLSNLLLGPNLLGISQTQSDPLAAPWPDIVISAGRRNEPVARWIKTQSKKTVRLVHMGRPWAQLHHFDLIISTPQYNLPPRENVLYNTLPLHALNANRLSNAKTLWEARFAHLSPPFIAVLIGGDSGAFPFDNDQAVHLGQNLNALSKQLNASLLVTTSRRTPLDAANRLARSLDVPNYFFHWDPNETDNPYFALLAMGSTFVVTGDSISMLCEACLTGKPVYIFDLCTQEGQPRHRRLHGKQKLHYLAGQLVPHRMRRERRVLLERIVEEGYAAWLGDTREEQSKPSVLNDLDQAKTAVRALFDLKA